MFTFFKKKPFCKAPFEQVIVLYNGDVWFCCDAILKKKIVLGNINDSTFEYIWNSKIAKEYRKLTLKNLYPYCYKEACRSRISGDSIIKSFLSDKKILYKPKMSTFPRFVMFNSDCECNVNCITCRSDIYKLSDDELLLFNERIETCYIPLLKDAEIVMLNGCGEALASRHSRALIKAIIKEYPKIKFGLLTNGILCDEINLKQLGLEDKLIGVIVSLNASTKKTYEKFVINGNYERVMQNIFYLKQKFEEGKLKCLIVSFVITALNYKEIPEVIAFANENNLLLQFLHFNDWKNKLNYSPEYLAVHNPKHPEFQEYLKIYKEYIIPYNKISFQNFNNNKSFT